MKHNIKIEQVGITCNSDEDKWTGNIIIKCSGMEGAIDTMRIIANKINEMSLQKHPFSIDCVIEGIEGERIS